MDDFELDMLNENPAWQHVLQAYVPVDHPAPPTADADAEARKDAGWQSRVDAVDGISAEELTAIHGKLIALGYLKFDLEGRHAGMQYRLSHAGKQALSRLKSESPAADTDLPWARSA